MMGSLVRPITIQTPILTSSSTTTRPDNTTTYAVNDVVGTDPATNLTFANVSYIDGRDVLLMDATLRIEVTSVPASMAGFKLYLYNAAPTAIADNTSFDWATADKAKFLTIVEFSVPLKIGASTGYLWTEVTNINRRLYIPSGNTVYGVLVTLGAYAPTAQAVKVVTLGCMQL